MAALSLGGARGKGRRIALVNQSDAFIERVRLQETIARPIAARIPSITVLLAGSGFEFIRGQIAAFDAVERRVRIATPDGARRELCFERALYALGGTARTRRSNSVRFNGAAGLVVTANGRIVTAIMMESDDPRIAAFFGVSNPDKLRTGIHGLPFHESGLRGRRQQRLCISAEILEGRSA
jgi:hypothetical protein